MVLKNWMQRYDENPGGTILKTECYAVVQCCVSTETRLIRSRYYDCLCLWSFYPITTSSTIISTKPMAKPMVLRLEC